MKKKITKSHLIALWTLALDTVCTGFCLWFCYLAIISNYQGGLPYLTAMIAALQAATAIVLNAYFDKSKAENKRGGIVYETAIGSSGVNVDAL